LAAGDGPVIYANVEALWSVSFLGKVKAVGLFGIRGGDSFSEAWLEGGLIRRMGDPVFYMFMDARCFEVGFLLESLCLL